MTTKELASTATRDAIAPSPYYRSGVVARMVRMPVSTLRIWEQRYKVVAPATTPTGHRLYSAADVQRLALLKQLTEHGHAIGAIAALSVAQLQQVVSTHVGIVAGARSPPMPRPERWRLVVVGTALARRLQRPAVVVRLGRPPKVRPVLGNLAEAVEAAEAAVASEGARTTPEPRVDLLIWQAPSLHASALPELKAAAGAWGARHVAVVYRFAGAAATDAFAGAGVVLLREPQNDDALGEWLAAFEGAAAARDAEPQDKLFQIDAPWLPTGDAAARRFDDATLTDFAGLSSTIACECPRHLAELLLQLSTFEAYSAECESRSPADAALHAYLTRVAGASRALFESALERVAIHEGLMLPSPCA
ncbi:MAG: MerR family transcriptional regulator [Rhodoferax sp.]|nr:MerR family transcriptional regulator [Rhodoferax sp.]